jgi:hypothetical protein
MTPSPTENRLAYVLEGPWAQKAVAAEEFLAKKRQTTLPLHSSATQALSSAPPARARAAELTNIFRAHWQFPVTDIQEQALRDSFDEALNTLQLLELGIETGYYTTDQLRETVVAKFDELFWSQASIDYLTYYQYVNIRFLAARYGVDLGLPPLTPPTPNPGAEVRYATFLSIFSQFYADEAVKSCLHFLDDYVLFDDELTAFTQFLTEESEMVDAEPLVEHLQQLSEGFYKLILWLNDVFEVVSSDEEKYFALFFSYWLIKLLGYTPTQTGYVHNGTDWMSLIDRFPNQLLIAGGYELDAVDPEDLVTAQELLRRRLLTIRNAWHSAQLEIEASTR